MGVRNGSLAMLVFLLLVVVAAAPNSILGGRTTPLSAVSQYESTSFSSSMATRSAGPGFQSARKLLEQRRQPMEAATEIHPPPLDDDSASKSVPTAPAAAASHSRFAFLFRSLAKGSPTPTPGTPSPGHN